MPSPLRPPHTAVTRYKSNIFANFAGTGITALLQLAFIPFYIKLIGIEAFGLIGFYIMLQAVMQVLDLGLGSTMNREMAINGLMNLPYALQLACGWTRIGLQINTFLIVAMVPAIIFMTMRYGAVGGAASWALLNGAYLVVGIPLTHRRLLPGDARRWVVRDVALPLVTAMFVAVVGRHLAPSPMSPLVTSYTLLFLLTLTTGLTAMAAPEVRAWILSKCRVAVIG